MITTQGLNEIIKPMERGQITIPIKIRKKLNITPKTWLWVRLVQDKILIEPVLEKASLSSLSSYLNKSTSNPKVYWAKKDSSALEKVRKKSSQRMKRLVR